MSIPQVKFSIIASGTNEAKNALKSVQDTANTTSMNIRHVHESNALKIKEIEERKAAAIKQINGKVALDAQQKAEKIKNIEERVSNQIIGIKNRESLRTKHIQEKSLNDSEASYKGYADRVNQILSGVGSNKIAGATSKLGSIIDTVSGSSSGGMSVGAIGASAGLGVGIAAVGGIISATGFVVKTSLELIADGLKYTAGQFTQALLTIGGARNISESLIENAKNNRAATVATYSVTGEEVISSDEVRKRAKKLSENSAAGSFTEEQWIEAQAENARRTGKLKSTSMEDMEFAGKLSLASGSTPKELVSFLGLAQQTNPTASQDQIKQLVMDMVVQGQKGAFGIEDLIQNPEILSGAGSFGGDRLKNIITGTTLLSLAKGQGATGSAASTQITQLDKHIGMDVAKGEASYGSKLNKGGQITNRLEAEIEAFALPLNKLGKHVKASTEAMQLRNEIRSASGVSDTDSYEQAKQKISDKISSERVEGTSPDEFNNRINELSDSSTSLKGTFNKLSGAIGENLGPLLEKMVPSVENFVDAVVRNGSSIESSLSQLGEGFSALIPLILMLGDSVFNTGLVLTEATLRWAKMFDASPETIKGLQELKEGFKEAKDTFKTIRTDFVKQENKDRDERQEVRAQVENILKETDNLTKTGQNPSEEFVKVLSETLERLEASKNKNDKEASREIGKLMAEGFKEAIKSVPPALPNRSNSPDRK